MKKQLAVDAIAFTEPFRDKIKEIGTDETYLRSVVKLGRDKAHESAAKTIREVRDIIGFRKF